MFSWFKKLFSKKTSIPIEEFESFSTRPNETKNATSVDIINYPAIQFNQKVNAIFEAVLSEFSEPERHNYSTIKITSRIAAFTIATEERGISIPPEIKDKVLSICIQEQIDYSKLYTLFLIHELKWKEFEHCCELCLKHNLYPYAYSFLKQRPVLPNDLEEALCFVKISQLRKLLKNKGIEKVPTKKEEVLPLSFQYLKFDELSEVLEERLQELNNQFNKRIYKEKINIFGFFIYRLSENLFEHYRCGDISSQNEYPTIRIPEFISCDDLAFINMYSGKNTRWCFNELGHLIDIPPLFPGDYSTITYRYK